MPLNERTPDENEAISQTAQAIHTRRREGSQAEEKPQGRFKFELYKNNLLGGQRREPVGAFCLASRPPIAARYARCRVNDSRQV